MNRISLAILALASLSCVFGWETYRAWTMPVLRTDGTSPGEAFSLPSSAALPQVPPPEEYRGALASVLARPVFRPDRRPYRPEESAAPARNYPAELSRYTLQGVLLLGEEQKALVVGEGTAKGERWEVGAGDELPGFTVKAVAADGLVLSADGREFVLPLYAGGPKGTGGALRTEVSPPRASTPQPPAAQRPGTSPPLAPRPAGTAVPPRPAYVPGTASGSGPAAAGPRPSESLRDRLRRTFRPSGR